MEPFQGDRASLPRNMIENTMFEEEPDVVDLAKETPAYPLDPDDVVYEPRSSRLLVRGLGENDMDEDEEDYESSARLLGMSFMNRSSSLRPKTSNYARQDRAGSCSVPSTRTLIVGVFILVVAASVAMVIYFLPRCTFTKEGCHRENDTMELIYPRTSDGQLFPWTSLRLPDNIRPVHYELEIQPNLTTMTFNGKVSIQVNILNDTKMIVLHSSDMKIINVAVQSKKATFLEYKPWQQIAIKLTKDLKKDESCLLEIEYSANLSNKYMGFYNSSYIDKGHNKRVLVATQFEPLAARNAFPCFDEPAFKATFRIKINREDAYIALSNMPKNQTIKLPGGLLQDEFEKSLPMSTYLVAFIVANFSHVSRNASDTLVSVYAVPDKVDQLNYALDSAVKLLEFYNKYAEIKFPLKKLDLVAIPDFLAGAMENWGLITFRETALLVCNQSSLTDKQGVAAVIAHELAHQWFGNLVTMKWWNDLWLNEGFATYMEFKSVDTVFPELEIGNSFLSMRLRVLEKDSLNSSHPVSTEVSTPEQVEEMFDSVSYEKGASVLLMLSSTMSEEKFHKGVTDYLQKYKEKNADTEDFWKSLPLGKSYSVVEIMKTWTLQKGFPLVTVNRTGNRVTLSQEHFLFTADPTTKSEYLWHIPLTYVNDSCGSEPDCKQMFHLKDKTASFDVPGSAKWLKFNFKTEGFYIVTYEAEGWDALIYAINNNTEILAHEDRAGMINNLFMLSRVGKVSFRQIKNLLKYLHHETQPAPLMEALIQLDQIYNLLEKRQDTRQLSRMKAYILDLFGGLMDSQSWEEETSISKQELRSDLLTVACRYFRENCTKSAMLIFNQWMESNKTKRIPGDIMKVVFSVAAQSDSGWETLLSTYKYSMVDIDKRKMLVALASTDSVRRIVWLMQDTLEGSNIQTQELPLVLRTVSRNFAGHLYAWNFVKENWDTIIKKFPIGSFVLQDIIMSTTSQFSTERHLVEVQYFFASLKDKGSEMRCVSEAVETIKLNIQWMERNPDTLWN
ncbi:leucyl-cystinyl aminopeptidase [Paramormyrops kingsleyae]|uniref:Leucyl/cystinyl aminopeptidase n=1 Tax=Paramormyrops kingsleyae TaxID=1676925 RepID=A0A3B3T4N0_9TELE|nr:leucyl-cystinyl aminopeptidase [Paramormyrops kingsleyae]